MEITSEVIELVQQELKSRGWKDPDEIEAEYVKRPKDRTELKALVTTLVKSQKLTLAQLLEVTNSITSSLLIFAEVEAHWQRPICPTEDEMQAIFKSAQESK